MARARNIKPGFFKNEVLGVADPLYSLLFEGLWLLADKEGRLEDRPLRIKGEIFPYRDGVDTDAMLAWLQQNDFLVRYSVAGKKYIQITNFTKHQNPHKNEAESEIPAPGKIGKRSEKIGTARADSLIPDSLIPEVSGEQSPEAPASPPADSIIAMPIVGGQEIHITTSQSAEWGTLFPAVDVPQELREMRAWLLANPTKRKTRSGLPRFITSWLGREQDKPRMTPQTQQPPKLKEFPR